MASRYTKTYAQYNKKKKKIKYQRKTCRLCDNHNDKHCDYLGVISTVYNATNCKHFKLSNKAKKVLWEQLKQLGKTDAEIRERIEKLEQVKIKNKTKVETYTLSPEELKKYK